MLSAGGNTFVHLDTEAHDMKGKKKTKTCSSLCCKDKQYGSSMCLQSCHLHKLIFHFISGVTATLQLEVQL